MKVAAMPNIIKNVVEYSSIKTQQRKLLNTLVKYTKNLH